VIPVIDLYRGMVVQGIAGRRETYRPLHSPWAADARPESVLRGLRRQFSPRQIYVADLDAIVTQQPDEEAWRQLAQAGTPLLLDAGITDRKRACERLELARKCGLRDIHWIVALESLAVSGRRELNKLLELWGADRAVFSLDLQAGRLLTHPQATWPDQIEDVVERVVEGGFRRLIVLDLRHVGSGRGPGGLDLCRAVRAWFPGLELISGGGVRTRDDLRQLAVAGCRGALVSTALHQGTLTAAEMWISGGEAD
jgi:phosphoribosylformimino-5-aminoimidazole carboxamide ribotide isomerase